LARKNGISCAQDDKVVDAVSKLVSLRCGSALQTTLLSQKVQELKSLDDGVPVIIHAQDRCVTGVPLNGGVLLPIQLTTT